MAGSPYEIMASGFSAVAAVNIVLFFIIRYIFKAEFQATKED
jgi:hypothetical protein